jgi:D-alanyl-D-alanine carboxypeptidase (penicillin-binding protein 5/6)
VTPLRLGCLAALTLVAAAWPVGASQGANGPPSIEAAAYLAQRQGRTLWAKDPHQRLPPASLTKIMTAVLVVERVALDAVVLVSRAAAEQGGARLGLKAGDQLTVKDLLVATLVRSANDACLALAEHSAGNEVQFVGWMNRRARELGLRDTHFANACGWDAPRHYASAADLATLVEAALRLPQLAALVALPEARVQTVDGRREFVVYNTNLLVGRLPGVIGMKSGFTRGAGRCVIAVAERAGVRVVVVVLNGSNRWWDAAGLVEHAFAAPPQ